MGVENLIPELSSQEKINLMAEDSLVEVGVPREVAGKVVAKTLEICRAFSDSLSSKELSSFSQEEKALIRKLTMDSLGNYFDDRALTIEFAYVMALRAYSIRGEA